MTIDSITMQRPDDWHVHFRDGAMLSAVVPFTAMHFARAIIMPNLAPPITTIDGANAYRERILMALPEESEFVPLMTCYLTDDADSNEIIEGYATGVFSAVKFYPAGATTNSNAGVTELRNVFSVFERMQEAGMPLLVHGEVTDPEVDVFDREAVYIDRVLNSIIRNFPELKVVMEHITTKDAVDFVRSRAAEAPGRIGATITAHHLVINRTDIFRGGIRPHLYCLPIAKREFHRLALREAAISGESPFFLGTDTAPHANTAKETSCGCAGIFNAPTALGIYTQVFDEEGALDKLEAFASLNGPAFYGLEVNEAMIRLQRTRTIFPETVNTSDGNLLHVFGAGETFAWRVT